MAWCFAALLPKVSKSEWVREGRFGEWVFAMKKTASGVAVCPLVVCSMALRQVNLCYNRLRIKPTDLLNYFCCCYTSALLVWEHQDFGLEIGEEEQILGALSATQHQKVHHS